MNRLGIPNGISITLSHDGRYASVGHVVSQLVPLRRVGTVVEVAGPVQTLGEPGLQSYSGQWLDNERLIFAQDAPPPPGRPGMTPWAPSDRTFMAWTRSTGAVTKYTESRVSGIGVARDGVFLEARLDQPRFVTCEGWTAWVGAENESVFLQNPDGQVWSRDGVLVFDLSLGPDGNVLICTNGSVFLWRPASGSNDLIDVTIQPATARFPWGEGKPWCWRRPDDTIWMANWVSERLLASPEVLRTFVLVRPIGEKVCLWSEFGGINHISAADDGDHIIVAGAYLADAYAAAITSSAPLTAFNPPVPPVMVPEPHRPTLPVNVTVTAPRWVMPYFGGHLTDARMPPLDVWERTGRIEAPGTCHLLGHPYGNDPDPQARWEAEGRPGYGWAHYVAHGGTRPVVADLLTAADVPDGMLIALRAGVEGSDEWTPRNRADIQTSRDLAMARGVPCVFYLDMSLDDPKAQQRILSIPPERVGEELILECQLYPFPNTTNRDLAVDEARWRAGMRWASTAIRSTGNRIAMARKFYVRIDDTIGYVEAVQPIETAVANEFAVFWDGLFCGWRRSGIYLPTSHPVLLPSNRLVLEPWAVELTRASASFPLPAKFLPRQPQVVIPPKVEPTIPPVVKPPKPRKKSWLAWE